MDLLELIIQGNLTADPEVTTKQKDGKEYTYTHFSVASNGKKVEGKEQETYYQNCVAFGETAKYIGEYYKKGSRVLVMGRPKTNNYTNNAGEKVYSTQLVVEKFFYGGEHGNKDNNDNNGTTYGDDGNSFITPSENDVPEEFLNDPNLPFRN